MAKVKRTHKKRNVNPEDARQTKQFFLITAAIVLVLLILLFGLYSSR